MNSEPIPKILYQDDDLVIVNKPAGLVTETSDPAENSLQRCMSEFIGRPAIAYHRLDKETTGCILFGKTARYSRAIAALFEGKGIRKEYWAVVEGDWPKNLNRLETRIAPMGNGRWENREDSGKRAITTFRRLGSVEARTWLQALPKTGRTHQIRLHCAHVGCPVVGDSRYGRPGTEGPLMLHARKLTFRHPSDGRTIEAEAEPPGCWDEWLSCFATKLSRAKPRRRSGI